MLGSPTSFACATHLGLPEDSAFSISSILGTSFSLFQPTASSLCALHLHTKGARWGHSPGDIIVKQLVPKKCQVGSFTTKDEPTGRWGVGVNHGWHVWHSSPTWSYFLKAGLVACIKSHLAVDTTSESSGHSACFPDDQVSFSFQTFYHSF